MNENSCIYQANKAIRKPNLKNADIQIMYSGQNEIKLYGLFINVLKSNLDNVSINYLYNTFRSLCLEKRLSVYICIHSLQLQEAKEFRDCSKVYGLVYTVLYSIF